MKKSSIIALGLLCVALAGCGGGGGGGGSSSNNGGSTPSNPTNPTLTDITSTANLTLDGATLAQTHAYPSIDGSLEVITQRDLLLKVNAYGQVNRSATVIVKDASSNEVYRMAMISPTSLPTTKATSYGLTQSYQATIPKAYVNAGMKLEVRFDEGNVMYFTPNIKNSFDINVSPIPVKIVGTTGQVQANLDSYLFARLPVNKVNMVIHPTYTSSLTTFPANETEWNTKIVVLLGEIDALRTVEGGTKKDFYYGVLPKRTYGVTGIGFISGRAAVGWDMPSTPEEPKITMVHEIGHNMSLRHAPCGGASGVDISYPYSGGFLGSASRFIDGFNSLLATFINSKDTTEHDVMGYCTGSWFSDYNARKARAGLETQMSAAADYNSGLNTGLYIKEDQDLTLIHGQIGAAGITLFPVKTYTGVLPEQTTGSDYLLRVTSGGVSIDYPFSAKEVTHTGESLFQVSVPATASGVDKVQIFKNGAIVFEKLSTNIQPLSGNGAQVLYGASVQGDTLVLGWDKTQYETSSVYAVVGKKRFALTFDNHSGEITQSISELTKIGATHLEWALSTGLKETKVKVSLGGKIY